MMRHVDYYSLVGTRTIQVKYTVHPFENLFDVCMYWYILHCTGVNVITFFAENLQNNIAMPYHL